MTIFAGVRGFPESTSTSSTQALRFKLALHCVAAASRELEAL